MVALLGPEEVLAHASEPQSPEISAALDLGHSQYKDGQYEAALNTYRQALELAQSQEASSALTVILNNMANVLSRLGDEEDAVSTFKSALEVDRSDWLIHYNLGVHLGRNGYHEAAMSEFTAAHQLEPGATIVAYNLGHANQHLGKYRDAISFYREVLAADPFDYSSRYNLCVCCQLLGEHKLALDELDKALEIWDDDALRDLRREILREHLMKLVKTGFASWSGDKPRRRHPPVEITPGPPVSDFVIQDRG